MWCFLSSRRHKYVVNGSNSQEEQNGYLLTIQRFAPTIFHLTSSKVGKNFKKEPSPQSRVETKLLQPSNKVLFSDLYKHVFLFISKNQSCMFFFKGSVSQDFWPLFFMILSFNPSGHEQDEVFSKFVFLHGGVRQKTILNLFAPK